MQRVADGRQNRRHPPSSSVAATRLSPEIRPTGTIHHRSRRKKRTRRREYKKGGDSKGGKEDRKEGAGPRSKASGDAWQRQNQNRMGGSSPPSLYRDPHVLYIRDNAGLGIEWYLHVTDRCRDPSRVIRMWGLRLLFRSQPTLKLLPKSSKFIVRVQVAFLFSHSTFSIFLLEFVSDVVDTQHSRRL